MRVVVDDDVIAGAMQSNSILQLHELMNHIYRSRHTVIGNFEDWFQTLDNSTANAYRNAVNLSVRSAATNVQNIASIHVKLQPDSKWTDPVAELSLNDALRVLREPLGIIVENSHNDWNFLLKLVSQVDRDRLDKAHNEGWITILHGGGADMVNNINQRAINNHTCLRTFALFDSDRHHPDELCVSWEPPNQVSCQGYNTEKAAKQHLGFRYWRLERRFIESYLPKAALRKYEESNPNVEAGVTEAFFNLTSIEQWYFNMKSGFKSISNQALARRKNLYVNVAEPDLSILHVGFGRSVASCYTSNSEPFIWDQEAVVEYTTQLPKLLRLI